MDQNTQTLALPEAVIVDVDGTLCDNSSIMHYLIGETRNLDRYHRASEVCPPNTDTIAWVDAHRIAGRRVIILTARKARWAQLTRSWLRKNRIDYDQLITRRDDDDRPDWQVKSDALGRLRTRYEIVAAIDDNPSIIDLWEREQVPATIVPGWVD